MFQNAIFRHQWFSYVTEPWHHYSLLNKSWLLTFACGEFNFHFYEKNITTPGTIWAFQRVSHFWNKCSSTVENLSTSVNAKVISLNVSLNVLWNISSSLPRIFSSIISSCGIGLTHQTFNGTVVLSWVFILVKESRKLVARTVNFIWPKPHE